jgi:hypothetical protein
MEANLSEANHITAFEALSIWFTGGAVIDLPINLFLEWAHVKGLTLSLPDENVDRHHHFQD